jgi:hypothetical protein
MLNHKLYFSFKIRVIIESNISEIDFVWRKMGVTYIIMQPYFATCL